MCVAHHRPFPRPCESLPVRGRHACLLIAALAWATFLAALYAAPGFLAGLHPGDAHVLAAHSAIGVLVAVGWPRYPLDPGVRRVTMMGIVLGVAYVSSLAATIMLLRHAAVAAG